MLRPLLALALVAPALAGCLSPAADVAPAADVDVDLATLGFASPVALPDGGGGEPNIAALSDGTLFVTVPTGLQAKPNAHEGAAWLWRSQDGGETWETLRSPGVGPLTRPGAFCSCDADVVTSPDDWVYYSDWWDGGYLVERSDDGGDTWMPAPITTLDAALLVTVDRQWLVAGPDGFVGLFYAHFPLVRHDALREAADEFNVGVSAVYSHDHGETWSRPVAVVTREAGHGTQIAHPRMLADGTLVMPWADVTIADGYWRDAGAVKLAVSTDGGETWTHKHVADAPEGFDNLWAVQADVTLEGVVHVGWAARLDDERMGLFHASSADLGETWSNVTTVCGEGLNFLPWVATAADGRVALGWYGGDVTGEPDEAAQGAEWFAYVAESADGGATWTKAKVSDEPVKRGPMCPRGAACDGERELLDYVGMVYAPDGRMHYAYARSSDDVQTLVAAALSGT